MAETKDEKLTLREYLKKTEKVKVLFKNKNIQEIQKQLQEVFETLQKDKNPEIEKEFLEGEKS